LLFAFLGAPFILLLRGMAELGIAAPIAVVLMALLARMIVLPLALHAQRQGRILRLLQPKVQLIEDENKGDETRIEESMVELYKSYRVSPLATLWPNILQGIIFLSAWAAAAWLGGGAGSMLWPKGEIIDITEPALGQGLLGIIVASLTVIAAAAVFARNAHTAAGDARKLLIMTGVAGLIGIGIVIWILSFSTTILICVLLTTALAQTPLLGWIVGKDSRLRELDT